VSSGTKNDATAASDVLKKVRETGGNKLYFGRWLELQSGIFNFKADYV
jgi:hypothetical protein